RGHEHRTVANAVRLELVRRARATDARNPDVHFDEIVEHGRCVVLDRERAHDELVSFLADVHPEHAAIAEVLDASTVEVGEIAAVVDDSLRVRVGEADADVPAELESAAFGRVAQERMTASASSRLRSISSGERASRFSRSNGSVFDGRTFMCQSSASTDRPSRCEIVPSLRKRSFSSCSFTATSETGVFSSPVMKYFSRYGARMSESFSPRFEISSSMSRNGTTPESACENSRK